MNFFKYIVIDERSVRTLNSLTLRISSKKIDLSGKKTKTKSVIKFGARISS